MKSRELEAIKKTLIDRKKRITEDLRSITKGQFDACAAGRGADEIDMGSMGVVNHEAIMRGSTELRDIDSALAKITKGTYGICEICKRNIPAIRLNALPNVRLCIKCAEEQE